MRDLVLVLVVPLLVALIQATVQPLVASRIGEKNDRKTSWKFLFTCSLIFTLAVLGSVIFLWPDRGKDLSIKVDYSKGVITGVVRNIDLYKIVMYVGYQADPDYLHLYMGVGGEEPTILIDPDRKKWIVELDKELEAYSVLHFYVVDQDFPLPLKFERAKLADHVEPLSVASASWSPG